MKYSGECQVCFTDIPDIVFEEAEEEMYVWCPKCGKKHTASLVVYVVLSPEED